MQGRIDATVLGAGVMGLAAAWALARRGARVRVVDPQGVAAGASGGVVGALAPHAPERWTEAKAFQLDSLLLAPGWWAEVAAVGGGDPGYARLGRLQPVPNAAAEALTRERAAAAATLWRGEATWTVEAAPADGWGPGTGLVIRDTLSARLHPRRACDALARAVRARGGTVATDGDPAGAVIHATGWHGLAPFGGRAVKGQAALLGLDRASLPQLYVGGLHVVPHDDGTVAVGSTTERDFADGAATDDALDAILARAREAVPALGRAPVIARWAGLRPRARSRAPLLGPWPGRPGHWVVNGGFKTGFGMAPLMAERLADLVLDGVDRIPATFAPPA